MVKAAGVIVSISVPLGLLCSDQVMAAGLDANAQQQLIESFIQKVGAS